MSKKKHSLHGILEKTHKTLKVFKGRVDDLKKDSKKVNKQKYEKSSKNDTEKLTLVLSGASVAKATLIVFLMVALVYFVVEIRDILVVFFVSFLLAAALTPAVDFFERRRIPRGVGVLIIYFIIFLLLGIIVSTLIPLVASQISDIAFRVSDIVKSLTSPDESSLLAKKLAPYIEEFSEGIDVNTIASQLQSALQLLAKQLFAIGGNVWGVFKVISNGLLNLLLVLVLTFIMTVNKKSINEFIPTLFPTKHASYIADKLAAIQNKIGFWVRGQLLLSTIVGVVVVIALALIGFEYAVTLALIAFFTELIPVFGPLIALLIALPIALNQSLWMVLWVAIFFLVFNWIESNIIVPLVMRSAVDISPLVIMFAMLVGAQYLGVLGLILAVPVAAVVSIFVRDYIRKPKTD